ncbi:MAG: nickel-dependent hydrogenase large subunit [Candidatus Micrarchaeota archaeon]|nr:nickel-dependent hydrogenase large subunit [Candidatus Micrarchaeota archaeon]
MHHISDISINDISKIEGHASLEVNIKEGKVIDTKLKIMENKRFYTQAIRGMDIENVSAIVSRICGTCSVSHMTCCIEALENALGIEPSEQTLKLRNLSMFATILRDHAMHLYLFCLPDIFCKDSVLDFNKKEMGFVKDGLKIKKAANNLATAVAGRAVHALYPRIGGFSSAPKKEHVRNSIKELGEIRESVLDLISIFFDSDFEFLTTARNIALVNPEFNFVKGRIMDSTGKTIADDKFKNYLHRVIIPYSQATGFKFEGERYIVGALSRINLNKNNLSSDTLRDASEYLSAFPSKNIFHNNLAQAIEMLHCIDASIEILEASDFHEETPPSLQEYRDISRRGIGVVEAPRGTLFYELEIRKGKVIDGFIVIPTAQNQVNMERNIGELVQQNLDAGLEKHAIEHNIETLIRAYDPCMSCASHFLKVKWNLK